MLESIFSVSDSGTIGLLQIIISVFTSLLVGFLISITYKKTNESPHSANFAVTLVLLPAIISIIIMLIGSDVAKAFSLAGAFSIIRFRSSPGEPKDIAFVLFALAAGLASGAGVPFYALIFSAILCLAMFILHKTKYGRPRQQQKELLITVPEDLDYDRTFQEVMQKYTRTHQLKKVKVSALGTLLVLTYLVQLHTDANIKQFIDELRSRNGNLNISLNLVPKQLLF